MPRLDHPAGVLVAVATSLVLAGRPAAAQQPTAPEKPPTAVEKPAPPGTEKAAPPANEKIGSLPPGETAESGSRTLTGHTFMHPVFLDSAFLSAYFGDGTRIGFESASAGKSTLNVAAVFETIDFGIPIGKRVQLAFDGNYHALFGTDTTSLFVFGGNVGFSLQPGLRVLLYRNETTGSQLSAHGSALVSVGPGVTPFNLLALVAADVQGLASNPTRLNCLLRFNLHCAFPGLGNPLAAAQTNSNAFGGDLAVNYAQAFGHYLGVQATLDAQIESSSFTQYDVGTKRQATSSSTPFNFEAGVGPALNLYPLVPMGLQVEYLLEFNTASASDGSASNSLTHDFVAGFYYTGRRDLQLGINGTISVDNVSTTNRKNITTTTTFDIYTGAFNIFYYF